MTDNDVRTPERLAQRDLTALLDRIVAITEPDSGPVRWRRHTNELAKRAHLIAADVRVPEKVTHGRHCPCSACAREDWTRTDLAACGMHGPSCPREYAPVRVGPDEGLRAAARDLYRLAVGEHGHDETHSADWPSCLPAHIAMNRYRDAVAAPSKGAPSNAG